MPLKVWGIFSVVIMEVIVHLVLHAIIDSFATRVLVQLFANVVIIIGIAKTLPSAV